MWFVKSGECLRSTDGRVFNGPFAARVIVYANLERMMVNVGNRTIEVAGTDFVKAVADCAQQGASQSKLTTG